MAVLQHCGGDAGLSLCSAGCAAWYVLLKPPVIVQIECT